MDMKEAESGRRLFAAKKQSGLAAAHKPAADSGKSGVKIGEFVAMARGVVEDSFSPLWLAGEVANFTRAASGHWYFVLRDELGQADCVMLARQNTLAEATPAEGDAVEVFAQPTIYPPRGRFQLAVRFLRQTGAGRLYQLFMTRKREWAARGWFDAARKKSLPFMPGRIGVIGSESGAAVRDVFAVLAKRFPAAQVVLYPAPAQGADAAPKIAAALDMANRRGECEVLILCRGGGGIEDLWAFNEEEVVLAIVRSGLPVITGIGHEIDETLADYAADCRAATPTAAATKAVPDSAELSRRLQVLANALATSAGRRLADDCQKLDWCAQQLARLLKAKTESAELMFMRERSLQSALRRRLDIADGGLRAIRLRKPAMAVYQNAVHLQQAALTSAAGDIADKLQEKCAVLAATFGALNPQRTLSRGYSITTNAAGKAITDAQKLSPKDKLQIQFAKGKAKVIVNGD